MIINYVKLNVRMENMRIILNALIALLDLKIVFCVILWELYA